jgi:hypothetical protein
MLNILIERAKKRQDQWRTIPVRQLPDPYSLTETTILGSYSYSKLSSRTRIVVKKDCVTLDGDLIETPSAIARDYLREKYKRGPIIKSVQAAALMDSLYGVPNYAKPRLFEHGFYVDIKSAYWSIMKISGWNVDYWPGKWLSIGTPPDDFPFYNHKIARNCLVSAGVPSKILRYTPRGQFDEMRVGSPLANISLFKLIQDVLNSIAEESIAAGAIYVNTDGFIAPNENIAAKIINIIEDWGLVASIKGEGEGGVKGAGAYKVGNAESVPWSLREDNAPIKAIHAPHHRRWLKKAFSFWSRENT